ncbi:MAG: hypothetical protein ACTSR3_01145 [Candidatus Helarchaeota archaeon]
MSKEKKILILKDGTPHFKIVKEKPKSGRPTFWDNERQKKNAHRFKRKWGLDFRSIKIQTAVRTLLRMKDPNYDWSSQTDEDFDKDFENLMDILENDPEVKDLDPLRDRIKDTLGIKDTNELPPPKNFHSPLPIEEWVLFYAKSLFIRREKLTRQEIMNMKQKDIAKLPNPIHRKLSKRQLLKLEAGQTLEGYEDRVVEKPYIIRTGLYKSQKLILKHFKKHKWAVIEIFRSAGKTYIVIALLCYMILEYPRKSYAYICEEQKKAETRLRTIRNILVSEQVINDYGYRLMDSSSKTKRKIKGLDSSKGFVCHRGKYIDGQEFNGMAPTLMAMSWTDKQAQGFHYHGVVFDDVWSIKMQRTKDSMIKFMEWWSEFEGTLDECEWFFMLRTRKGVNDLYSRLDRMGVWVKLHQKLVLKYPPESSYKIVWNAESEIFECKILDKEKFKEGKIFDDCFGKYWFVNDEDHPNVPIPKQLLTWRARDPLGFEREIQNNPYIPEGRLFKWKDNAKFFSLKNPQTTYDPILRGFFQQYDTAQRICVIDNSFGVKEDSDYNCIMVICKYRGFYFLEYMDIGHWGTTFVRANHIATMISYYPNIEIWIEADRQQHIIRDLKMELLRRQIKARIKEFISHGKGADYKVHYMKNGIADALAGKKGKIHSALEAPFNAGLCYFNKDLKHIEGDPAVNLKDQFIQFPDNDMWDLIDTFAMGILVFREYKKGTSKKPESIIAVC